jgi:deoxyribonuclease V
VKTKKLHDWNLSYSQARELQGRLACKVRHTPLKRTPRTVAGIDCAFSKDGKSILAVVVVLECGTGFQPVKTRPRWPWYEFGGFEIVETVSARRKATFPYIPGLLSFREAPVCIAAVEKLQNQPDVFIIDGQGIAHPRRLGLAAHLGLFFDKPTIGCAKSRLIGEFQEPPPQKGAYTLLTHKNIGEQSTRDNRMAASPKDGIGPSQNAIQDPRPGTEQSRGDELIGAVLRTRTNVKPVFVSVGHKCLLEDAVRITLACATKYRLPEPTRLAHQLVGKLKLQA